MLTQERVMEILKEAGVLLESPFPLDVRQTQQTCLQCAKIFRNTENTVSCLGFGGGSERRGC